jgi:hypothetical protein
MRNITTELHSEKVIMEHQEHNFVSTQLLSEWVQLVPVPYFKSVRERLWYLGERIVIIDECTAHDMDYALDEMTFYGIIPVFIPPHSSDQTQPLDLSIFALQKAESSRVHPHEQLNSQIK